MNPLIMKIFLILLAVMMAFCIPWDLIACDTWVALPDATTGGYTILGKNSDRTHQDCQPLFLYPRQPWPAGSEIDLGRLKIPQVKETFATLGSSPYWCWGYEEGINEHGVAIGNEGIRTRVFVENLEAQRRGKGPEFGPTGMDLIRLGLERGKTAWEALQVITGLLERYGQFGSGLPAMPAVLGGYENAFIIADPEDAWVLETAGTHWVAKRVAGGVASISNTLSIERDWDLTSQGLVAHAVNRGWWSEGETFDFTKAYLDPSPTGKGQREMSLPRAACSRKLLDAQHGEIDIRRMMGIARDRSSSPTIDRDNTASSCVAVLPTGGEGLPIFWWCPATPSSSCYVPFFVHGGTLPGCVSTAGTFGRKITPPRLAKPDRYDEASYWWRFRVLANKTEINYDERNPVVRETFDALEQAFAAELPAVMKQAAKLRSDGEAGRAAEILDGFTASCVDRALAAAAALIARFDGETVPVSEAYAPYLGKYRANFGPYKDAEYTVLVQNGRMAVDVPGQRVYQLEDPDEEGKWAFALSNQIAISFERNAEGRVHAMKLYQADYTFTLPRIGMEEMKAAVTLAHRLERLSAGLEEKRKAHHIPGMAIAVVKDGEVILARGFGLADLEKKKPVIPDTLFAIGSTTKAFTATLMGMLVDDGKVSWDDPVTKYLPDFIPKIESDDQNAEVTLRDLLCHRTGFTRMGMLFANGKVPRQEILKSAVKAEPWAGFREKWHYNNIMFMAAGAAAGRAAGTDWDSLMRQRILKPLGMESSCTSVRNCRDDGRLSLGYQWDDILETHRHLPMRNVDNVGPAGSINSNVLDMARWVRFLLGRGVFEGKRLISEAALEETWKPQMEITEGAAYGFGWLVRDWKGQPMVEHGGNIDGFAAQVALLPESDLGFVLLANVTGTPLQQLSINMVWETILGEWKVAEVAGAEIDYEPYLGEYMANFGTHKDETFEVLVKNGRLALNIPKQMVVELEPPGDDGKWRFSITDQISVAFVSDPAGQVVEMKLYQGDIELHLPRVGVEIPPEVPLDELDRYLGSYYSEEMKETVKLVIKYNNLALDIPGQKVYALHAPNEEGKWIFRVLDRIGVSFEEDDDGRITAMTFYEGEGRIHYDRVEDAVADALPTVEEVLALRETGRRKAAIEGLGLFRLTGKVWMAQSGVEGKVTCTVDGMERSCVVEDFGKFGRLRTAVDAGQAWIQLPHGLVLPLLGKYRQQAKRAHPTALAGDWRDLFEKIRVLRSDELDGRTVHVLELAGGEAPDYTIYVDVANGDVLKAETQTIVPGSLQKIPATIRFEDFREVKGVRLPFRMIGTNEAQGRTLMQFTSVESGLDPGAEVFRMPEPSDALKESSALTPELRRLNLESFDYVWITIRDKFWDPELGGLDWEAVRRELRPKVEQARSMADARAAMREMLDRLQASHCGIEPGKAGPDVIEPSGTYDGPNRDTGPAQAKGHTGIDLRIIGGRALVTAVEADSSADRAGVKPGWEIVEVDGEDVAVDIKDRARRLSDTPRKMSRLTGPWRGKLRGPIGDLRVITFRDGTGRTVELKLTMAEDHGKFFRMGDGPTFRVRIDRERIEGDLGYITFNSFIDPAYVMEGFNDAMRSFKDTSGIVIDVRGNGGGMGQMACAMIGWMVEGTPKVIGTEQMRDGSFKVVVNPRAESYHGPVAVLVDEHSGSAAEAFADGLQVLGRACIIGTRTTGAVLAARTEKLPNGDRFDYGVSSYISAGGEALEGRGVLPDIEVHHTREALLQGRDLVLETAIAWLRKQEKPIVNSARHPK